MSPWLRTTRQQLVEAQVPAASRNGVTGILSAAEPTGFVVGAALFGLFGSHLTVMCLVAAGCSLGAFVLGAGLARRRPATVVAG